MESSTVCVEERILWVRKQNERVFKIVDAFNMPDYSIGQNISITELIKLLDNYVVVKREGE